MRKISYSQAIVEATAEEMRRDPAVVLWGIDIGPYGGAFGATRGLYEEFGPERVIDMPVSELGYVGAGVGAAATGLRPIVELQFSDWITLASDMLINQAAKLRYMFGGEITVPMVLRAPVGAYLAAGAQHSDSFESLFAFVPGIKVVMPATAYDAKGLLKSAIQDNNLVLFFEHKKLYEVKGEVPEEEYLIPLAKADVKRQGKDVTVVAWSFMVTKALAAAARLAQEGIEAEVVDLRSIDPLDEETVLDSVKKTGHLVIVQEAWRQCSVSSEIAAIVAEKAIEYLDAQVVRVTAKDVPHPFAPVLENFMLPNEDGIVAAVNQVLGRISSGIAAA
ncbi:MAG: alpha-ketoacid dehydrogenase subunit beta [Bryobacterales bacterium]|nr:alpha-ketoacid dehydrogenase subunit beta [Bryobacterales bacterium]